MAERITPRLEDFSQWYQDIVQQAKLADYSPVKGCMVIRPNGYAMWEAIQKDLDRRIKETGARNAYFPLFIPESFIKKEAEHVEGFAPQCAVVTYAGAKDLEEKLIVRPTSETIINSMFAKWIQSYRDLPLMVNQWANVVRWEMRTRLFLRTTEFLWQEGHTCFATPEDAEANAQQMLKVYTDFAEEVLAMPVVPGLKSESEKFAGALRTYSIEAMMQDKKALQAGTSHNLSNHFAKAFETKFLNAEGKQEHVYQTSWGVSTRLIGGVVMTHSDDRGLVLPPRLAHTHIVIVPIFTKDKEAGAKVTEVAKRLAREIEAASEKRNLPYDLRIHVDTDDTKQAGWKFHEYEVQGIPLRIELGPKDLEKKQVVLMRRDWEKKQFVPMEGLADRAIEELVSMQKELLERARKWRDEHTFEVETYAEFKKLVEEKDGGFFVGSWSQDPASEAKIKEETKATVRCILLDENFQPKRSSAPCMITGQKSDRNVLTVFARSY